MFSWYWLLYYWCLSYQQKSQKVKKIISVLNIPKNKKTKNIIQSFVSFYCSFKHYILEVNTIRNCPSNYQVWEETSKYCYKIFTRKLNWTEAESNCRKFGGNLISISSSSISDAVKKQMKNKELGHLWIGLDKKGIKENSVYASFWFLLKYI